MKIAVLGGGSSYIPELVDQSIKMMNSGQLRVEQIALMDSDKGRVGLVGKLCERMIKHAKAPIELSITTDSKEAIEGSDFVISQIRVGTLDDRVYDEKFPLKYGLIGQESTGAGGFSQALRSVPVLVDYAKQIEKWAPTAYFLNNTNPQRVTHEAINRYSKARLVGICEHWRWTEEAICSILNVDPSRIRLEVIGLQHLNWATKVYLDGKDVLPRIIDQFGKARYPEWRAARGWRGLAFDPELIKSLRMIPNGYLRYFYYHDQVLNDMQQAERTRGEYLKDHYERFFKICNDTGVKEKPDIIVKERAAHRWGRSMMPFIKAVTNDENSWLIINVKNNGAVMGMDPEAIMEIPTIVNKTGAHPIAMGEIPLPIRGLIHAKHAYSVLAARAAIEGSYDLALIALMTNPLVSTYNKAKEVLDDILKKYKKYLPNFYR